MKKRRLKKSVQARPSLFPKKWRTGFYDTDTETPLLSEAPFNSRGWSAKFVSRSNVGTRKQNEKWQEKIKAEYDIWAFTGGRLPKSQKRKNVSLIQTYPELVLVAEKPRTALAVANFLACAITLTTGSLFDLSQEVSGDGWGLEYPHIKLAFIFRFWDRPLKNAATSFEEMTLWDKYYWAYKNNNPILRSERGQKVSDFFKITTQDIKLPQGFEKKNSLTFAAAGDLFNCEGLENSKDTLFENISDLLFDSTISYANFESPLTDKQAKDETVSDKGTPVECCTLEEFNILKGHQNKHFNVLNTANNHMFDMGVQGVERTQKAISGAGIVEVGTNSKPGEFGQGNIFVKDGIKLGFVSATFGLNGRNMPAGQEYLIKVSKLLPKYGEPQLDLLKRQIDHCKSEECDFIIASLHWGFEFEFFPRKKQVSAAHELIEYGADAILCHHSHVIQPVEYYATKRDPNRIAVICYSLGSLVWSFAAPYLALSIILNLTLSKGNFQGKNFTYIEASNVTPVFGTFVKNNGQIVKRVEKLSNHINNTNSTQAKDYVAKINKYANLVLKNRSV